MYYLIYISTATDLVDETELHEILTESIARNEKHDLTGLLIYNSGMFIQMIEGFQVDVESVFEKINGDPRHRNIEVLSRGPSPKRYFPNWKMALKVTLEKTFRQLKAFEDLKEASEFLEGIPDDHIGIRLLRYFHRTDQAVV